MALLPGPGAKPCWQCRGPLAKGWYIPRISVLTLAPSVPLPVTCVQVTRDSHGYLRPACSPGTHEDTCRLRPGYLYQRPNVCARAARGVVGCMRPPQVAEIREGGTSCWLLPNQGEELSTDPAPWTTGGRACMRVTRDPHGYLRSPVTHQFNRDPIPARRPGTSDLHTGYQWPTQMIEQCTGYDSRVASTGGRDAGMEVYLLAFELEGLPVNVTDCLPLTYCRPQERELSTNLAPYVPLLVTCMCATRDPHGYCCPRYDPRPARIPATRYLLGYPLQQLTLGVVVGRHPLVAGTREWRSTCGRLRIWQSSLAPSAWNATSSGAGRGTPGRADLEQLGTRSSPTEPLQLTY